MPRKPRNCLRCGQGFLSTWAGHRLCGPCHDKNNETGPLRDHFKPIPRQPTGTEQRVMEKRRRDKRKAEGDE